MKVLHLTLRKKWFDMIASGEKPEEYRDIKLFWIKRLCDDIEFNKDGSWEGVFKKFTHVHFACGGHFHPDLPQMRLVLNSIAIGTGKPEWGAEPGKEYFVIKLGEIIK